MPQVKPYKKNKIKLKKTQGNLVMVQFSISITAMVTQDHKHDVIAKSYTREHTPHTQRSACTQLMASELWPEESVVCSNAIF